MHCYRNPGYSYYQAPAIMLLGAGWDILSPHGKATAVQLALGGRTLNSHFFAGNLALLAAGVSPAARAAAMRAAGDYFYGDLKLSASQPTMGFNPAITW